MFLTIPDLTLVVTHLRSEQFHCCLTLVIYREPVFAFIVSVAHRIRKVYVTMNIQVFFFF